MGAAQYQGKPSPVLRARLDHALALWQRGLAPRMLLTGGTGEGDTASEAAVSRVYMMSHGVPDTAILLENEGRTSAQSLALGDRPAARARAQQRPSSSAIRFTCCGLRFSAGDMESIRTRRRRSPRRARSTCFGGWANLLAESFKAPLALFVDW